MKIYSSNFNRSILVIGGAGYIGSHVVLDLCDKGYDVTVFDNLSSGFQANIDQRADLVIGDILNEKHLSNVFKKKYVAVFHFAALTASMFTHVQILLHDNHIFFLIQNKNFFNIQYSRNNY